MASIRDVAKEAGVSPATVSRTFTTPNLINALTQQRVLAAATRLEYSPPRLRADRSAVAAFRPRRAGVDAIGFQFFSLTSSPGDTVAANNFYAPVLSGALAEASALDMHLLVHTTTRHGLSVELPRMILERAIGGLLLVGTADPAILRSFAVHVPHIVLVDNHDETETHESVVSDGFSGAFAATRYLLDLGHRRIGFYLTEEGVTSFRDRLRGYRCALIEAGIAPDPALAFGVDSLNGGAAQAEVVTTLRAPDRPTGFLCCNDDAAVALIRTAREIGLRTPDDLSVVGFDDTHFAATCDPPLTTVRVDKEFLGRLAVRRLRDRSREEVGSGRSQPPVRHVVPVSLVIRGSCKPLV
jgi:LacI family transcriptional regulator